jgi:hypothetical protein
MPLTHPIISRVRTLASLAGLIALGIALGTWAASANDVPRMDADDLLDQLGEPHIVVIDVRSAGSWDDSGEKITGAFRATHFDAQSWAKDLDRSKTYVLYCS